MQGCTPRERFFSIAGGKGGDRAALINPVSVATAQSAAALGIDFSAVHTDADSMAKLAAYSHERLGFDSIMPNYSVVCEAHALGAPVHWGDAVTMPSIRGRVFAEPEQVRMPADYLSKPTTAAVIKAIAMLREKYPDALIIGKAMGPWTLSLDLHGVEDTLIETLDDPEKLHAIMDALLDFTSAFTAAQLDAGADVVTIGDHCTRNLIGPGVYTQFLLPLHKKLCAQFPDRLILHCCGNTEDRVADFAKAGFMMYHFESANSVKNMLELAGGMPLTGCINNPEVLLLGGPDAARDQCTQILRDGVHIISPECAVPLETKNENLLAISEAIASFGPIAAK